VKAAFLDLKPCGPRPTRFQIQKSDYENRSEYHIRLMEEQKNNAKLYMQRRLAEDVEGVLELCADSIVIDNVRDGRHEGKEAVRKYLTDIKPMGTWTDEPTVVNDKICISGVVRILFMNWDVTGYVTFNEDNKIEQLILRRGRPE